MAYISKTNTITGLFKNYAIVELELPFYNRKRAKEGDLCLYNLYDHSKDHILTYFYNDPREYDEDMSETFLVNETMLKNPFNWEVIFNIDHEDKKQNKKVTIKLIVPIIDNTETIKRIAKTYMNDCYFLAIDWDGNPLVYHILCDSENGELITDVYCDELELTVKVLGQYRYKAQ